MQLEIIFAIVILIMSVIIHEISHGYAAERLGDPTARLAGRLTLNPFSHLDMFGSVILPLVLIMLPGGGPILGWAKPVPYNPYNLKNQRWGEAMVAAAGPLSNFFIALVFGLLLRFSGEIGLTNEPFLKMASYVVLINLILAVFNSVPIPPLDGSKMLFSALPYRFQYIREFLERNWLVVIAIFIFFLWRFILPLAGYLFTLITGLNL